MIYSDHRVTNFIHRSISEGGLIRDQLYRVFIGSVYLGILGIATHLFIGVLRKGIAILCVLGASACASDVTSYYVLGGVVDWIGVGSNCAIAPTDPILSFAPVGIVAGVLGAWIQIAWTDVRRTNRLGPGISYLQLKRRPAEWPGG